MPYTYMLGCEDAAHYVGSTVLHEERIQQHQLGLGATTRAAACRSGWCGSRS